MKKVRELFILTDYRGAFYSTIRNRWGICSLDLNLLTDEFRKLDIEVAVRPYSSIDFRRDNFNGKVVLYQSAEDPNSLYKEYVEDLLLGIHYQGGILVPSFQYFRAHHNKVFMEIMRDISGDDRIQKAITTRCYGTFEDLSSESFIYPVVLKAAWGAGSSGVKLAKTPGEMRKIAYRLSRSAGFVETAKELYKRYFRRTAGYVPSSLNRRKFIVQDFVPGLTGDFKVLVYWDKYYVVARKNRPGDFRASGSGLLEWPEEPPVELLTYAKHVFDHFQVPLVSLDIAISKGTPVLIECQFVNFGPAAMEQSNWFFRLEAEMWVKVAGTSLPEAEFARSITSYLQAPGRFNRSAA